MLFRSKPLTRSQFILGKFLGCWLACGLTLLCFYLFFGALSASREHQWPLLNYFQAATLHWFMLGIIVAATLLGSLVFAAPSSNSTILFVLVGGILFVGRHLDQQALKLHEPIRTLVYSLYFAVPHLELFDVRDLVIHNWPLIPWLYFSLALLYALGYMEIGRAHV